MKLRVFIKTLPVAFLAACTAAQAKVVDNTSIPSVVDLPPYARKLLLLNLRKQARLLLVADGYAFYQIRLDTENHIKAHEELTKKYPLNVIFDDDKLMAAYCDDFNALERVGEILHIIFRVPLGSLNRHELYMPMEQIQPWLEAAMAEEHEVSVAWITHYLPDATGLREVRWWLPPKP